MDILLVATHNQGKLRELQTILGDLDITLRSLRDVGIDTVVDETGNTYEENARLKAEGYLRLSGLPTLADDSGLEVAALQGAPGVYSSTYGGVTATAQFEYLLKQLEGLPFHQRLARYVCVIALARPGHPTEFVQGTWPGVIEFEPRGSYGFGYDPLFYVLDQDCTVAELTPEQKNAMSHRAAAARAARSVLARWQAEGWPQPTSL
ncbi:MAG: RdgB/HAM1 family non-canonical purine NTP pyrophosphatase [Chloroflexaceae bacterium]|nr:RdgB/HAM1 family non-canonical purine NTP pyrophosphatase [Chloroflexaceae bacterium]